MLGFEHPSHMVTHPSTDEAQCCLSLEIFVNSAKKKKERKKMKIGSRVPSELRGLINSTSINSCFFLGCMLQPQCKLHFMPFCTIVLNTQKNFYKFKIQS